MRKIHIYSGPPASGKSTYIKGQIAHNPPIHLSRDAFRATLREFYGTDRYFPTASKNEWQLWIGLCNTTLTHNPNLDIHFDQTTISVKTLARFIDELCLRSDEDALFIHVFETPLETCLKRNALRRGYEAVPPAVIEEMFTKAAKSPINADTVKAAGVRLGENDRIIRHYSPNTIKEET